MGSIAPYQTRKGKRYRVRYRKPDTTQTDKRGFATRREAELFLSRVEVAKSRSEYIDPKDSRTTVDEVGEAWLTNRKRVVKPSYARTLQSTWDVHVHPKWGNRPLSTLVFSEIQEWVSELSTNRSATTVVRAYGILAGILDTAVKDRRLATNIARGVSLPRKRKKPHAYLSHKQVDLLAGLAKYATLVLFIAYTGLRWGEAIGLRLKYVDFARRRVRIEENAVEVKHVIVVGTPKDHEKRTVRFPRFLEQPLRDLAVGKSEEDLLFGNGTDHLRRPASGTGWFVGAVKRAHKLDPDFPTVTPHDLRHTAASLAVSANANVKAVQRMLGHASAAMTLDTYSDLFDDDLDAVADALDRARAAIHTPSRRRQSRSSRRGGHPVRARVRYREDHDSATPLDLTALRTLPAAGSGIPRGRFSRP